MSQDEHLQLRLFDLIKLKKNFLKIRFHKKIPNINFQLSIYIYEILIWHFFNRSQKIRFDGKMTFLTIFNHFPQFIQHKLSINIYQRQLNKLYNFFR